MKKSANLSWRSVLLVLTVCGLGAGVLRSQTSKQLTANAELGQPNFTSSTCDNPALSPSQQLCHPVGVAVNNANGPLFVADGDNNRGLIWPSASGFTNGQPASVVLGQPSFNIGPKCTGGTTASTICDPNAAAFDPNGSLWVADTDGGRAPSLHKRYARQHGDWPTRPDNKHLRKRRPNFVFASGPGIRRLRRSVGRGQRQQPCSGFYGAT